MKAENMYNTTVVIIVSKHMLPIFQIYCCCKMFTAMLRQQSHLISHFNDSIKILHYVYFVSSGYKNTVKYIFLSIFIDI